MASPVFQIVLYQLADSGRAVCFSHGIDPGSRPRESLEHKFWVDRTTRYFERQGFKVKCEHPVKGNGAIEILATRPGHKVAVEIETGKFNIRQNLNKIKDAGFDRIALVATSPVAVSACQKAADSAEKDQSSAV